MQLPALIYKSLRHLEEISDDSTLFNTLKENSSQLIKFLTRACEDETWAEDHGEFMREALSWVTEEFFQDRLLMEFAKKIATPIRQRYGTMQLYLPLNLTVKLKDRDFKVNSFLYSSSSEYLRETIRRECRDAKSREWMLKEIPFDQFKVIHDYVTTESIFELYRKDRKDLIKILNIAMLWELEGLSVEAQNQIKKYLTPENMFTTLIKAHQKRRSVLRRHTFDFINAFKLGFRLEDRGIEYLAFEFLDFNESSLQAFETLRELITHLIFSKKMTEEKEFPMVIKKCPHLICLDISRSEAFSDFLTEIPSELQQLEAASCSWLNNETFMKLIQICPNLDTLVLTSNVKIDFEGWGALNKLEKLRNLNLSRCPQIRDEELRIILQACKELIIFNLEDCRAISDDGFLDLPKYNANFTHLNLARTAISDQPLIEIGARCSDLITLNLTRCENLTSIGILTLVKNAQNLKELNVTNCDLPKVTLTEIKKIRPFLHLIH